MSHRIAVISRVPDTRRFSLEHALRAVAPTVTVHGVHDAYSFGGDFRPEQLNTAARLLVHPVTEEARIDTPEPTTAQWVVEIGYRPGVTDPWGDAVRETLEAAERTPLGQEQSVHASRVLFLSGLSDATAVERLAYDTLANSLIERVTVLAAGLYTEQGLAPNVPRVSLHAVPVADRISLDLPEQELVELGKKGLPVMKDGAIQRDSNGNVRRRGPLALDLISVRAIKQYFEREGRNPTDAELELFGQTWSEHCKHTIFANPTDDIEEGLFKRYIRGATEEIGRLLGAQRFWGSVFSDNAGALIFDSNYFITLKAETHNTPTALDPFGGVITGIVGVNRDALGFGLGAKPVANSWDFCFADPRDARQLYRKKAADGTVSEPLLTSKRIMYGALAGLNAGGNESGIPTVLGGMYFDPRFRGKPLAFVETDGLIPRRIGDRPSDEKAARPGDYIVMVGGRVGMDGIHGATFSSEELSADSPVTAVQIGAPITQKRLSDMLVNEARGLDLYTSITDNGAGGLFCSVYEMARESRGATLRLDAVPLKYPGLQPNEIGISESQERMTLAVPKEKFAQLQMLGKRRGVEVTVIGEFTDSGRAVATYGGETVVDVSMEFLHNGFPARQQNTLEHRVVHEEPPQARLVNYSETLTTMLARPNIAGQAFTVEQLDHEVQGGSVLKPLQGVGRVGATAIAYRPVLDSPKAVIKARGMNPSYSDISTYDMAAAAIDMAVRNAVAAGADPQRIGLLDNFCWCSSDDPQRLWELKEATRACYDVAVAYKAPFVSGKDSIFNDFKGFDEQGDAVKLSIPPTLRVSAASVIDDATKTLSLDAKFAGDIVYVIGDTHDEFGGSEYFAHRGEAERGRPWIGNSVPFTDTHANAAAYRALHSAIQQDLVASACAVNQGGLAVTLAKKAIAGNVGMAVSLDELAGSHASPDAALFAESQGRIVVTVAPKHREAFEKTLAGVSLSRIGTVTNDTRYFTVVSGERILIDTTTDSLGAAYRSTFEGY